MHTVVLFSYPRSGNTRIRNISEVLTGRPSLGTPDNLVHDSPIHTRMEGLAVDGEAVPSVLKRHELHQMEERDAERPLVVTLRNYKECIVRHRYHLKEQNRPFAIETESRLYLTPLAYLDHHAYPKLLLYYEDLLEQPVLAITRLARFLEVPEQSCIDFLDRYQEHRARSLAHYPAPSFTRGEKTVYHRLRLRPAERRCWDDRIRAMNPAIYDQYLTRYREPA